MDMVKSHSFFPTLQRAHTNPSGSSGFKEISGLFLLPPFTKAEVVVPLIGCECNINAQPHELLRHAFDQKTDILDTEEAHFLLIFWMKPIDWLGLAVGTTANNHNAPTEYWKAYFWMNTDGKCATSVCLCVCVCLTKSDSHPIQSSTGTQPLMGNLSLPNTHWPSLTFSTS